MNDNTAVGLARFTNQELALLEAYKHLRMKELCPHCAARPWAEGWDDGLRTGTRSGAERMAEVNEYLAENFKRPRA
jgi:hypothetical protein